MHIELPLAQMTIADKLETMEGCGPTWPAGRITAFTGLASRRNARSKRSLWKRHAEIQDWDIRFADLR